MAMRMFLFLIIVGSCWGCNARDLTDFQSYNKLSGGEGQYVKEVDKNENFCMLCEEFASEAFSYLSENKTQTEIISILHKSCTKIPTFKQQCIVLVDYYAPLFFLGFSSIKPEEFCQKVDLCKELVSISQHLSKDKCDICHSAVAEALQKLKDPDTECKRLVFEYTPIILVNAEQFLETKDVCTILHACNSSSVGTEQALMGTVETSMLAVS